MCTILYDVIKTVHLSLQAWHTRLFTDSIYNICWILHRGNRRRIRLCNCLLTHCACSRATAVIQKAWSKHMKFVWRIHTAHVRLERVVLTREANVWNISAGNMLGKKFPPTRLFLRNFGLSCANCAVRTTKFIHAIWDNIVIQLFCKFQESNWNPDWFIALMNSFNTNHILDRNENQ